MYIKTLSGWKKVTEAYIKTLNGWKKINDGFIKTLNGWKRFWSTVLAPQFPVTISQSTNSTTYLITLTGTNYSWTPGPPSLTYYFEWSTNGGSSWTTLSSGSAINPSYGSSTSYTHQITTSQLSPNVVNTYRFRVYATYGSLTANSSATTTVQGPTDITLTAGDTATTSIPLTWTSSTGANRYLVEYKASTSSIWTVYSWVGTTYETIYGLSSGTTYNARVTPYTSSSNDSTYKAYSGNVSNTVTATTKTPPGNLSRVENYNFAGSSVQGFFTTGSNTTKVNYYFNCISIPSLSVPTYTQNTSSGIPYKIQQNILSYFTSKTWNYDTYSASTTYYLNNTVWYAGNQYRLTTTIYRSTAPYDELGVSGQVPTNTSYWTRIQTVTYNIGDYVVYNGTYYFCKSSTNGTYPTNTTYWIANSLSFQMYATPYNVDIAGNTSSAASTLIVRGDQAITDPLQISSGPTFSNITQTAFRTTFLPSVYTNQVDFYILKTSNSTYVTNYSPRVINVSGATTTNHDTLTTLEASTQYLVTINARYLYDSTYSVLHNGSGSSAYVTTAAPLPDPPTGLNVSDVGTNRPYSNAAYSLYWTAPSYTGGTLLGYKVQFQVPSTGTTWYDYSANTVDISTTPTSGSPLILTGFGSNLATNFRVYSVNSSGQSATAVATASPVTGTTVPQAPTVGTATTYNGYATVTYTANNSGGKAINTYTATSSPGGIAGSASSGSIFVYSLGHNTIYTFTVTATNANGTSAASSASNSIYGVNIGAPTITSSSSTSSTITLNFTQGTNSTSTRGYVNGSLDGTTSGTSYLFAGLLANTSYNLFLIPTATVGGTLYTGPSAGGSYSTTAGVPATPTGFSATTNRTDGVNLTWSAVSGATSYEIYWNIVGGAAPSSGSPADFSGITSTSYLDTTIGSNSSRDYWVRSRNASGTSAWSTRVTGTRTSTTIAPTTAPTMSVNGSVTIGGVAYNSSGYAFPTIGGQTYYNTSAKWTAVNNSPTYYEWQVWTNSALTGTNFGTTGNVLSATSSWVQATYGSFAYWRVRGGNSAGAGPWSSPVLVI